MGTFMGVQPIRGTLKSLKCIGHSNVVIAASRRHRSFSIQTGLWRQDNKTEDSTNPADTISQAQAAKTHYDQNTQHINQQPDYKSIIVTESEAPHNGRIKILSLNEKGLMNALSRNMVNEIRNEIEMIHGETLPARTRALIIASGSEKAFCAGANLKERKSMSIEEANAFLAKLRQTFVRISELPVPVIAAVNGVALGGGLELALCAHLRIFSPQVKVGQPEARLGIIPGAGGTYRLPAVIGLSRARELMLTGRRITGKEALNYGLCHDLSEYTDEDKEEDRIKVLSKSLELAREIASNAPLAIRAILKATRNGGSQGAENEAYDGIIRTRDRNEALAAFQEKRNPIFTGE